MDSQVTEQLTPDERVAAALQKDGKAFPVVGIGASAGGLKALADFFENTSDDTGMAYVVIIHLSPDFESHLAEVLQQSTSMPVVQVNQKVTIEPDKVYVIPPDKFLIVEDGHIDVSSREASRSKRLPIDVFFRTLADAHGPYAGGIVLSGTGADGTSGLARIKELAGVVVAQDPQDAEYNEMPMSAINTGLVDYVLPAARMTGYLTSYWSAANRIRLPPPEEPRRSADSSADEALKQVLTLLRTRTGHDYSQYKRTTVLRRVARRMQVNGTDSISSYLQYMRDHQEETLALERDLLISVTSFFRDPQAFATLKSEIIPRLFENKFAADSIRVWVAGCATGEEAYSVAILLHEQAETMPHPPEIQVFATDIDEEAIGIARNAVYPETIANDVTPERLAHFFVKEQNSYSVRKDVREMVLFAVHNLLKDPPFSQLDLVTCRNLLIYLNRTAQAQVLDTLHFALKSDGYLFLGTSETVDGQPKIFLPFSKHDHIFGRLNVPHLGRFAGLSSNDRADERSGPGRQAVLAHRTPNLGDLHRLVFEQYGPPSILVDANNEILHVSASGTKFLQFSPGEPSHNLLRVVHPDLRMDLRAALYAAEQSGATEVRRVRVKMGEEEHLVNVSVCIIQEPDAARGLRLVILDDVGLALRASPLLTTKEGPVVRGLEEELQLAREQLRVVTEQNETSTEELMASNEELQAINEELRSTTEELETSQEELQAVNEEIQTVNDELRQKMNEVSWINNDLQNLLASTNIATLFIGKELQIKRCTPQVRELFNIIPTDLDRPLAHVTHKLAYDELAADAEQVLQKLTPIEREISSNNGRWFLVRVLPYRTVEDKIEGVVITFVDITDRKHIEQEREILINELEAERARFEAVVEHVPAGLTIADALSGKIIYLSKRTSEIGGQSVRRAQTLEEYSKSLKGFHPDGSPYKPQDWPLVRAVSNGVLITNEEMEIVLKDKHRRNLSVSAQPVLDREGKIVAGIEVWSDITERKEFEHQMQVANDELEKYGTARADELANAQVRAKADEHAHLVRVELMRQLVTAQEEERRRISRELHDELGQLLTGLKFLLDSSSRKANIDAQEIIEARSVVDTVMSRLRELSANLRPSILDDAGLLPALAGLVRLVGDQTGVRVSFRHAGLERRFDPEIETTVYRVAQEALTNVARHSGVKTATLSVLADSSIIVQVADNGAGFDTDDVLEKKLSHGLAGMRERLNLVGGELTVDSAPGSGTRLTAEIPLRPTTPQKNSE